MSTLVTTKAYESVLLNKNVVPIEYDLAFDVDLENFIVQASAAIKINIGGLALSRVGQPRLGRPGQAPELFSRRKNNYWRPGLVQGRPAQAGQARPGSRIVFTA